MAVLVVLYLHVYKLVNMVVFNVCHMFRTESMVDQQLL